MRDEVQWFDLPFEFKKWKRRTKEERERDELRGKRSSEAIEIAKRIQISFPPSDPLHNRWSLGAEHLTTGERRRVIVAYLAVACLRLAAEQNSAAQIGSQ